MKVLDPCLRLLTGRGENKPLQSANENSRHLGSLRKDTHDDCRIKGQTMSSSCVDCVFRPMTPATSNDRSSWRLRTGKEWSTVSKLSSCETKSSAYGANSHGLGESLSASKDKVEHRSDEEEASKAGWFYSH